MAEKKKKINSKAKGSSYELKIAKILSAWWDEEFHRTPMSGGLHWKSDNRVVGDIVTPPDSLFPFVVECKKREEFTFEQILKGTGDVEKWWKQCTGDCKRSGGLKPMLIFSKNFAPNYLMIDYTDFSKTIEPGKVPEFNYFVIHTKDGKPDRILCVLEDFIAHAPKEHVYKTFNL